MSVGPAGYGDFLDEPKPPLDAFRPNGADIIDAYEGHQPLPGFADDLDAVHFDVIHPYEVQDPWAAY